jgi:hypothetical protein
MTHFIFIDLGALFILIISSAKLNIAMTQQENLDPYATIFLYSGRPNPRWQLSLEE